MHRKDFYAALLIIPIVLLGNLSDLLILISGAPLSEDPSFLNLFYGSLFHDSYRKDTATLAVTMFGLIPQMTFNLFYGTYLYKDLHRDQTYYFIRQRSKKKWFFKRFLQLSLIAACYVFVQVGFAAVLAIPNAEEPFLSEHAVAILTSFLALFTFTMISTMLVNELSFFFGSVISFFLTYLFLIGSYYLSLNLDYIDLFGRKINVSCLNIVDNTVFSASQPTDPIVGLLVNFFYLGMLAMVGYGIVKNYELSVKDKEI